MQINPYEAKVLPQGQLTGGATGEDFGASAYGAGAGLARSLAGIGEAIHDKQTQDDITNVHVQMAKSQAEWDQNFRERFIKAPPGDKSFLPTLEKDMQDWIDNAPSPATRQGQELFRRMSATMQANFMSRGVAAQADLDARGAHEDFKTAKRSLGSRAMANPDQIDALRDEAEQLTSTGIYSRVDRATRLGLLNELHNHIDMEQQRGKALHTPEAVLAAVAPDILERFNREVAATSSVNLGSQANPNAPRGIRNNNPGNLVKTSSPWQGEVSGSDDKFKTFASPEDGIAALAKNLLSYQSKGLNTVEAIINKWAPPSENDTGAYVNMVAKQLGVQPGDKINVGDQMVMTALTKAIIQHENGKNPYTADQIAVGVGAALTGQPPQTRSATPQVKPNFTQVTTSDPVFSRLSGEQQYAILNEAQQNIRMNMVQDEHRRVAAERARKEAQEVTLNDMFGKLVDGKLTIDDVRNSNLDFAHKERMSNAITVQTNKADTTDPTVFLDVFNRIHAQGSDPQRISDPDQLLSYVGHGLSFTDLNRLRGELAGKNDPFSRQVHMASATAEAMLTKSIDGSMQPELANEAAYRFNLYLKDKIEQYRKEGKDPNALIGDPNSRDYLLKPERVMTFMPRPSAAMAKTADKILRDQKSGLPSVKSQADYDKLASGDVYIDPLGNVRTKK